MNFTVQAHLAPKNVSLLISYKLAVEKESDSFILYLMVLPFLYSNQTPFQMLYLGLTCSSINLLVSFTEV